MIVDHVNKFSKKFLFFIENFLNRARPLLFFRYVLDFTEISASSDITYDNFPTMELLSIIFLHNFN